MKSNYQKLFLLLGVILFTLVLTSCYKKERFVFKEGKYEYTGEGIDFYNEIKIDYISLNFVRAKDTIDMTNIILNRKNFYSYYVDFYLENDKEEGVICSFISLPKVGDQIDRYFIELDISNFINEKNAIIEMVLEIFNSDYYKSDEYTNIQANQIFLTINSFRIDENLITEYSFPSRLLLEYIDTEGKTKEKT